ncbi:alpha-ketoglutarate-dependent 2,4-dichlorophenoxyacetate dioxygenase [Cryptococcus deuterogattii Ram5]|uniref:Alpha-ketoglutarate-dependent 2,4-dichlorophenoxyacetate dioxygenase n=1 Tax=Cryptococcus deuterogattii Ram5 TaxID=1296110 RepID=A0A0D0U0G5_9TREE|nr:alpha-ketoglutarate-dependent 2,4-dichlorophenoxyacetate dioxygenase [Cryptococcus deuterogattii Ram5]KIR91507.1 alpha-ketoglutarate-dependent 2,4-dichlorophenoxyacetate dioxygenase [Cryptococcus deuterogattii CBS 10090]
MASAQVMSASAVPIVEPIQIAEPLVRYRPLHPTFGAEATADFSTITPELVAEIKGGLAKYGVLVFRKTGLTDSKHVEMSHLFGDLDDIAPFVGGLGQKNRLSSDYLFDVGNVNPDGSVMQPGGMRDLLLRCNYHFHADSAFNPRRAGVSLLLAHELPPPECGGNTEFSDTRSAYEALSHERKEEIKDWVVCNSQLNCRRNANIDENGKLNPLLDTDEFDPMKHRFGKHKLVQTHEPSGRTNLYIAAHAHHVEGMPVEEGQKELHELLLHAGKPDFVLSVQWKDIGDLVVWDNTCTLHRSVPGSYAGKYKRDLRRTTVHDMSSQAWGLNGEGATWRSGLD